MHVLLYGSYTRKRYREATSGEIERMLSAPRLDHRTCPPGSGGDVFIAPADGDEEFWSAWHARHPQPAAPAASIASDAENLGRDAGRAAASWMFDGNTPEDTYRAVLRGIEEGDPAILGRIPASRPVRRRRVHRSRPGLRPQPGRRRPAPAGRRDRVPGRGGRELLARDRAPGPRAPDREHHRCPARGNREGAQPVSTPAPHPAPAQAALRQAGRSAPARQGGSVLADRRQQRC